jgi:hypothetical protein
VDGRERKIKIAFYGEGDNSALRVVPPTGFVAKGVQLPPAKVEVLRLNIKTGEVDSVKPSNST